MFNEFEKVKTEEEKKKQEGGGQPAAGAGSDDLPPGINEADLNNLEK